VDKAVTKPVLSTDFPDFDPDPSKILGKPGDNSTGNCAQLGIPMWITTSL
jgi:hypothetical protein